MFKTRKRASLIGRRFHRLVVESDAPDGPRHMRRFNCLCDCGNITEVSYSNLVSNQIKSCGCLLSEQGGTASPNYRHGKANTPEYVTWKNMIVRCTKPESKYYAYYGGRGISICEKWMTFSGFYSDMGDRPTPEHQIDRIDVDGNYEPGNCRWATPTENAQNKRVYKTNKTGITGICITAKGKFVVQVRRNKVRVVNKTFSTLEEAVECLNKTHEKLFKERNYDKS